VPVGPAIRVARPLLSMQQAPQTNSTMPPTLEPDLGAVVERVATSRQGIAPEKSVLVAVSGIDGCGKGFVTARLARALAARGLRVAAINIDGWLNLPHVRFDTRRPAEHFYAHAIRFEALFGQLVVPLRERRSIRVEADFADETAAQFRRHTYAYDDVDVILLEGIYLLKRDLARSYDLSVWIECSFETALERAIARAQEGLPPEETVHAYRTIYFPAQVIHFERDDPRSAATLVVVNDRRLEAHRPKKKSGARKTPGRPR